MCGDIFPCHDWEWVGWLGATGIMSEEVTDAAKHPTMPTVAPRAPVLIIQRWRNPAMTHKEPVLYPGIQSEESQLAVTDS